MAGGDDKMMWATMADSVDPIVHDGKITQSIHNALPVGNGTNPHRIGA